MFAKPPVKRIGYVSSVLAAILTWPALGQDLPTANPEEVGVSSEKIEESSKFMQSLVDDGKIAGGVTMMACHGKVIHFKAVGMADREAKKPMQTDSIFRIASMTKPITSVAVMMLWEEGKLDLDDPVSKYIPEFKNPKVLVSVEPLETRPAKREITIRDLLTHTSGLGHYHTDKIEPIYNKYGISGGQCHVTEVPLEQMMARLGKLPLLFDPGSKWEYSLSMEVLGRVVEVVSGMTLDRFIQERICQPLQMTDTFFKIPVERKPRLVAAYYTTENGIRKLLDGEALPLGHRPDFPYNDSHRYFSGGGGLCSTPRDYMRFCQMLLNGGELDGLRLLQVDTVKMMTTNQVGDLFGGGRGFGFGFGIWPDREHIPETHRGSYAWSGFWTTYFRIGPRGDWIFITMSQLAWDEKTVGRWFAKYAWIVDESIVE